MEISGCGHVLEAEVFSDSVFAEMPLPAAFFPFRLEGVETTAVLFDGIAHFLTETPLPKDRQRNCWPEQHAGSASRRRGGCSFGTAL